MYEKRKSRKQIKSYFSRLNQDRKKGAKRKRTDETGDDAQEQKKSAKRKCKDEDDDNNWVNDGYGEEVPGWLCGLKADFSVTRQQAPLGAAHS